MFFFCSKHSYCLKVSATLERNVDFLRKKLVFLDFPKQKQSSVFILKTLKCQNLGQKYRLFKKKVSIFGFSKAETILCFPTKNLKCEIFLENRKTMIIKLKVFTQ